MTDNTPNKELEKLKETFKAAQSKLRRFDRPTDELTALLENIRHATATNRMGSDPEYAKFMNEELASGITSELTRLTSFDTNVSPVHLLHIFTNVLACAIVRQLECRPDAGLRGPVCERAAQRALQRVVHLRHDLGVPAGLQSPQEPLPALG